MSPADEGALGETRRGVMTSKPDELERCGVDGPLDLTGDNRGWAGGSGGGVGTGAAGVTAMTGGGRSWWCWSNCWTGVSSSSEKAETSLAGGSGSSGSSVVSTGTG